jgi:DNA ligase-1
LERRERLETFIEKARPDRFDLSPISRLHDWQQPSTTCARSAASGDRGRHDQAQGHRAYLAGRPKGPWFKWKRDPYTVDAVLMYAQRGHGKRSSFYSDYHVRRLGRAGGRPAARARRQGLFRLHR